MDCVARSICDVAASQESPMINLKSDGTTATIFMSRPPVNAIDDAFVAAFNDVLREMEQTKPTVLVVRSDQKCFSAGADLTQVGNYFSASDGVDQMVEYVKSLHALFNR